jgi:putative ABC transport system permease protein
MVISVLERRPEIGLHRALGATKGQVRIQLR